MITTLRKPWGKRAMALVTALTLALPGAAAAAAPASAAPASAAPAASAVRAMPAAAAPVAPMAAACPGNRIVHKAIKAGGRTVGWLNVFHDRGSDTKCAVTAHSGLTWGKWAYTTVDIWTRNGSVGVSGDYRYRTGPVSMGDADGVCVGAKGGIKWGGQMRVATARMLCG
jgi:hypothetical protein